MITLDPKKWNTAVQEVALKQTDPRIAKIHEKMLGWASETIQRLNRFIDFQGTLLVSASPPVKKVYQFSADEIRENAVYKVWIEDSVNYLFDQLKYSTSYEAFENIVLQLELFVEVLGSAVEDSKEDVESLRQYFLPVVKALFEKYSAYYVEYIVSQVGVKKYEAGAEKVYLLAQTYFMFTNDLSSLTKEKFRPYVAEVVNIALLSRAMRFYGEVDVDQLLKAVITPDSRDRYYAMQKRSLELMELLNEISWKIDEKDPKSELINLSESELSKLSATYEDLMFSLAAEIDEGSTSLACREIVSYLQDCLIDSVLMNQQLIDSKDVKISEAAKMRLVQVAKHPDFSDVVSVSTQNLLKGLEYLKNHPDVRLEL